MTENMELSGEIFFGYATRAFKELNENNRKLAHYTSAEAGYNIIRSKTIWMRNVEYMNDYTEVEWGKKVVYAALDNTDIKSRLDKLFKELFSEKLFDEGFKLAKETFLDGIAKKTYITCLSEHDKNMDDEYGRLSMWRAYAKNNGVALIFNTEFTNDDEQPDRAVLVTSPVFYGDDVIREFDKIINRMSKEKKYLKNMGYAYVRNKLFMVIYYAILSIKHPSFKEEKEWRIILSFPSENEVANLNGILEHSFEIIAGIPQKIYKINLNRKHVNIQNLIDRIIIGPTGLSNNSDNIKRAFEQLPCEKRTDINDNLVHVAKIPLR